jgi:DNA repair exonuclease SbcCD ATPase subunit
LRLKEICIQGFRAFNIEYTFQFDPKITLFVGMNGTGKTSLCDAIQFGILGKLPQYKEIEEAKFQDMIINRNNPNKTVEVSIIFTDGSFITRKKMAKTLLKPTQEVKIFNSKGVPAISYEDFRSTIYLRQEQIRRFIEADRKTKEQELSALLGVEAILGIAEGIKQFKETLENEIKRREQTFEEKKRKAERREEQRKILLALKEEIVKKWHISEEELADKITVSYIVLASKKIQAAFNDICKRLKLGVALTDIKEDITSVEIFIQEFKKHKEDVHNKIKECIEAISKCENIKRKLEELGDKEIIIEEINEVQKKIKENEEKISDKNKYAKFIASAKDLLKETMPKSCPLCERPIDIKAVLERLDNIEHEETKEIQKLEKEIKNLMKKEQILRENLDKIKELEEQLLKLENKYSANENYSELERKILEMSKEFEQIEDLLNFRMKKREVDGLTSIEPISTEELDRDRKKLEHLKSLMDPIEILNDELQRIYPEFINRRLKELDPYIEDYVKILSPHPRFSKVSIRYEKENFWLKGISEDGEEVYARALFSTGQLNETAIILLLAMANSAKHKYDFIILDDPSQSLDSKGKERLAKLLAKVAESKQLVICTMDTEFAEFIKKSYPTGKFYLFEEYTEKGPVVKTWSV